MLDTYHDKVVSSYMSKLGKKGGTTRFLKYGKEAMAEMGRKSWLKRKKLIQEAKNEKVKPRS